MSEAIASRVKRPRNQLGRMRSRGLIVRTSTERDEQGALCDELGDFVRDRDNPATGRVEHVEEE